MLIQWDILKWFIFYFQKVSFEYPDVLVPSISLIDVLISPLTISESSMIVPEFVFLIAMHSLFYCFYTS